MKLVGRASWIEFVGIVILQRLVRQAIVDVCVVVDFAAVVVVIVVVEVVAVVARWKSSHARRRVMIHRQRLQGRV